MKKIALIIVLSILLCLCAGCGKPAVSVQIVATTKPVYEFTARLCRDTGLSVTLLVTENTSCLHDYSLQVRQMRYLESAQMVVISGAGLEDTMEDALDSARLILDASAGIALLCPEESDHQEHLDHAHEQDPHIWLDVNNAKIMAQNIYLGLCRQYPQFIAQFQANYQQLTQELDDLDRYAREALTELSCRDLVTFHDGFHYFAQYLDLHILKAIEEESGSEASARELTQIITLVRDHQLPAIFTETNGSQSAADIIARETGISVFSLDMGMSEKDYFTAMYHNIDTIKEALQ